MDADFALIPDIDHNMRRISIAEKGALFLKVVSHGRQAHGSTPEKGINAAWNLVEFLHGVSALPAAAGDELFSPPTRNLGMLAAGSAPNIVPARAEAQLDFRFLPGQSADQIEAALREIAARVQARSPGAHFTFERVMMVDPIRVDPGHPLVQRLQNCAAEVNGVRPELTGLSGSTVAKPLVRNGIMAVGFGPGDDSQAHAANESIAIDDLAAFARILGRFLLKEG